MPFPLAVPCVAALALQEAARPAAPALSAADLAAFARVAGLELSESELEGMLPAANERLAVFAELRALPLANGDPPATVFSPLLPGVPERALHLPAAELVLPNAERPADLEELAFASLPTLAALVKTRQVTCAELCELALARLERYDPLLFCVITPLPERARARAAELDRELEHGAWRGPLHGIPWGAKDLLAARGARTTWGAKPYEEQVLDLDAAVVERLDAAGAVLVAKLSLGALAMGDVWFGATTRNPWDPQRGSSGSSAGSASAVAAGLVPFAIGSETLGSLVSPSTRCGVSSLRPTFGRVSRYGAMTLCWSMDKLGPMARSAEDCALVLDAIQGADPRDPATIERPFAWPGPVSVAGWRVGYPVGAFGERPLEDPSLAELADLGVELVPVEIPEFSFGIVGLVLAVEAATAFDDFTRGGLDDLLVRQTPDAWPNFFRSARAIPAVEYLRAQRARTKLMLQMDQLMAKVDVLVHPPFAANLLGITNLTGHPTFVCPSGFRERDGVRTPSGLCFTGRLFDEGRLLALAARWQAATPYEDEHPSLAPPAPSGPPAAGAGR